MVRILVLSSTAFFWTSCPAVGGEFHRHWVFFQKIWLKGRIWRCTCFWCLTSVRTIQFIHLGLLTFLPYFLPVEINCSWGSDFCDIVGLSTLWHGVELSFNHSFLFFFNQDFILYDMRSGFLSTCISSFRRTKWKDTTKYIDSGHLDIASSVWLQASRELLLKWLTSLLSSMGQILQLDNSYQFSLIVMKENFSFSFSLNEKDSSFLTSIPGECS